MKQRSHSMTMLPLVFMGLLLFSSPQVQGKEGIAWKKFHRSFEKNMKAGETHYWGIFDCRNRDEYTGMPTSTMPLAGASRTFMNSADFTAHHAFQDKSDELSRTYEALRQQLKERLGSSYTLADFDESSAQLDHKQAAGDHVSVGISKYPTEIVITFYPPLNKELPFGNPCAP